MVLTKIATPSETSQTLVVNMATEVQHWDDRYTQINSIIVTVKVIGSGHALSSSPSETRMLERVSAPKTAIASVNDKVTISWRPVSTATSNLSNTC